MSNSLFNDREGQGITSLFLIKKGGSTVYRELHEKVQFYYFSISEAVTRLRQMGSISL